MAKKRKKTQKTISFTLTWTKIVQICLFFLIAMSWSFILGVLAGRGYFDRYLRVVFKKSESSEQQRNTKEVLIKPDEFQFYKRVAEVPSKDFKKGSEPSFTFQVAAFKNRAKAEEVKNLLKKSGFDVKIASKKVRGEVWHRVYVFLKGTVEREMELRRRLKELGLGKPVVVEKR